MEETTGSKPAQRSSVAPMLFGIVIGAVLVGGGFYAWNHRSTSKATTSTATTTTTTTTPATSTSTTTTPATTSTTNTTTAPTTVTYTNTQYGFSMVFPATWANYKIKTATYDDEVATLYIEMPTTDSAPATSTSDKGYYSPFALGVYTPAQWDANVAYGGPMDTEILKTGDYVFGWSHANGIPATDWTKDSDIAGIIASFQAK